jgi:multidrug transporter EmrE-like cation transporter
MREREWKSLPKFVFLGLIAIGTILEVMGDILFKKWALGDKMMVLGVGLVLYFVGTVFWALSLQHGELSRAISIFVIISLIGGLLAGFFLFHETISPIQKVGIGLGVISVLLMEFF